VLAPLRAKVAADAGEKGAGPGVEGADPGEEGADPGEEGAVSVVVHRHD
jgi:hypothetical protein